MLKISYTFLFSLLLAITLSTTAQAGDMSASGQNEALSEKTFFVY